MANSQYIYVYTQIMISQLVLWFVLTLMRKMVEEQSITRKDWGHLAITLMTSSGSKVDVCS